MSTVNLCKMCLQNESKYVCPRCNIQYCSLPCYQSKAHIQCSESFYKDCVIEQLQSAECDPQSQRNMAEILQRVQQTDLKLGEEDIVDSDDDDSDTELSTRLAGVDLDDADSVWQRLTADERQQFEDLLRSGNAATLLPSWEPWWFHKETEKLVEDIESKKLPEEDSKIKDLCPTVKEDISPLSSLSKATPSPLVRWGLVNVLGAYAVTARVYNGDHMSSALEAASIFVSLSENLSRNQLFENPETAVTAVHMAAVNSKIVEGGVSESQLNEDIMKLVEGPSTSKQSQHVLAALSDLHKLLSSAKQKCKAGKSSKDKGEFSKRFPDFSTNSSSQPSTSDWNKYLKKIQFYLSWTKECF